jgi:hypothetical protein
VNRGISLAFDGDAGAVGKVQFSDRLKMVAHRVFTFGSIGRFLAVGYVRSIDPIALVIQKLAGSVGLSKIEHRLLEFRVYWRQSFEDKVCALAHERTLATVNVVISFYADMGYVLPSGLQDLLYSRLIMALGEDAQLIAQMDELQRLPIGANALRRRLLALDAGVERHMPAVEHDMITGRMSCDDVVVG